MAQLVAVKGCRFNSIDCPWLQHVSDHKFSPNFTNAAEQMKALRMLLTPTPIALLKCVTTSTVNS